MPKVTRIYGGNKDAIPLRITYRNGRKKKSPSFRVKCGCCSEAVVFFPENHPTGDSQTDVLEINGVYASIAQWREVLLPVLGLSNRPANAIQGVPVSALQAVAIKHGLDTEAACLKVTKTQEILCLGSPRDAVDFLLEAHVKGD